MMYQTLRQFGTLPIAANRKLLGVLASALLLVAGCAAPPAPQPTPQNTPAPPPPPPPVAPPPPAAVQPAAPASVSNAATPREFRQDGARHIYGKYAGRIYKGKLPPLMYAVGVYEIDLDARGNVVKTSWLRAPSHAPEVMAEIDRLVRAAAPFPAPVRMGRVTYTDTWLWDESGRFQLDTLTEGQN